MSVCVVCQAEIREDARFCPSCGAEQPKRAEAEGDDPLIGTIIARNFRVEKLLGVGGMGKVYKAHQLSLDKAVVIKVLHDHFQDDPNLVQRFQREAKAASRLNHPNSIQVIDFGQDESGVLYMAIEFLNGTDLFSVLQREGPLEEQRIARIMVQVCSALAEAHEMNVIHRDLKPENIMVEDRRGRRDIVKVLDFGIAKIQDPEGTPGQALTQAGMVCGTPEYMSPEQARGQPLDARSDLYSLGVLTYQLATGDLPFQADSPIGIVTKHILEAPAPPRQKYPQLHISEGLEAVILRAMDKEPGRRYQTAQAMGEAFEALLTSSSGMHPRTTDLGHASSLDVEESATPRSVSGPTSSAAAPASTPPQAPASTAVHLSTPASPRASTDATITPAGVTNFDVPVARKGGGAKAAIVALGVALLVGGGAVVAVKAMGPGSDTVGGDNPSTPPSTAVAVKDPDVNDPVTPPVDTPPPDNADPKAPVDVPPDNGASATKDGSTTTVATDDTTTENPGQVANTGQATKTPKPTPPKDVKPKKRDDDKASSGRARALALMRDANKEKSPEDAYALLKQARKADPSYPEPLKQIAFYWKTKGDSEKACLAIRDYIKLKGTSLSRNVAQNTEKLYCK